MSGKVDFWASNIKQLEDCDPGLAQRLRDSLPPRTLVSPEIPNTTVDRQIEWVVLVGCCSQAEHFLRSGHRVWVIEPDLSNLASFLHSADLSAPLETGKLWIDAPTLLTHALAQVSLQCLAARLTHQSSRQEWVVGDGCDQKTRDFIAALRQSKQFWDEVAARVQSWPIRSEKGPPVTVVSPHCAIFDDLADCFSKLGVPVRLVRIPDHPSKWSRTRWLHAVRPLVESPSNVVLLRNRVLLESLQPGERLGLERFFRESAVSWWWDTPNVASWLEMRTSPAPAYSFAFARGILPLLPAGSHWLPPAARSSFAAMPLLDTDREPSQGLTFVGQSRFDALTRNLQMFVDGIAALGGNSGASLAKAFANISSLAVLHAQFEHLRQPLDEVIKRISVRYPELGYFLDYLNRMCESIVFRLQAIALLSGVPVIVYGDKGWLDACVVRPENYRGLIAPERLPELYQNSALNLNLNFMQVSTTVNPKVLDVLAAGGTVLTDHRPELDELFPDSQNRPHSFNRLDELADKVFEMLKARDAVQSARLCEFVRSRHTMLHRARQLCDTFLLADPSGDP